MAVHFSPAYIGPKSAQNGKNHLGPFFILVDNLKLFVPLSVSGHRFCVVGVFVMCSGNFPSMIDMPSHPSKLWPQNVKFIKIKRGVRYFCEFFGKWRALFFRPFAHRPV